MPTAHEHFSERFYKWEKRGRGWQVYNEPVCPEPPFVPFVIRSMMETPAVDNGSRPSFLGSLFRKVMVPPPSVEPEPEPEEEPKPTPLLRESLVELQVALPADLDIARDAMEQFFRSLVLCREPVAFELLGTPKCVLAQFATSEEDASLVRKQLSAHFPEALFRQLSGTLEKAWDELHNILFTTPYCWSSSGQRVDRGIAPEVVNGLPIGGYQLTAQFHRHPLNKGVLVEEGVTNEIPLAFIFGAVHLETVPSGAEVRATDGSFWGQTPLDLPEVTPQMAKLNLTLTGYEPVTATLEVTANQVASFTTNLVSISYVAVLHNILFTTPYCWTSQPVQTVNWYDCVKWCNARSAQAGFPPVYYMDAELTQVYTNGDTNIVYANWSANGYRLPTEAEWEKAARGGLSGQRFPWGNTISESQANYYGDTNDFGYDLGPNGYNSIGSLGGIAGFNETSPVGSFVANGYGLYDTAGSVFEWCWDWYGTPFGQPSGTNSTGPATGSGRVLRGGAWDGDAGFVRCADREFDSPSAAITPVGFRCVRGL